MLPWLGRGRGRGRTARAVQQGFSEDEQLPQLSRERHWGMGRQNPFVSRLPCRDSHILEAAEEALLQAACSRGIQKLCFFGSPAQSLVF